MGEGSALVVFRGRTPTSGKKLWDVLALTLRRDRGGSHCHEKITVGFFRWANRVMKGGTEVGKMKYVGPRQEKKRLPPSIFRSVRGLPVFPPCATSPRTETLCNAAPLYNLL